MTGVMSPIDDRTSYQFHCRKTRGTTGDSQRLMELLAIVQQPNKDKAALAKQIGAAIKQMGIEIRALRRIQDRQLQAAGILPKGYTAHKT